MFMSFAVTVLMLRENISDAVPCEVDSGHNLFLDTSGSTLDVNRVR